MNRAPRNALTLLLGAALLATLPGAALGTPTGSPAAALRLQVEELRIGAERTGSASAAAFVSPAPCDDRRYNLEGGRWTTTYRWWFRASSTPGYLGRSAAEATIKRGINNIVTANNDCLRPDNVAATASYRGRTSAKPSCSRTDGRNVVGFRPLAQDVAARACWWYTGNRIVEADVQINSAIPWATSPAGCVDALMLEAVMTHEAGHIFGVGHVGEKRHGRLTMSTFIDGPCNNQESTLGLGDMRALEALYP